MKTEIIKAKDGIIKAVKLLISGEIVAFPTETVYGLGAYALNKNAVKKIFKVKGRPADDPLIVHIGNLEDIKRLTKEIPPKAMILMKKFWPGPLTLVLRKSSKVPLEVSAGLETVAVRMPANKIALELCRKTGPIAAPSANSFGKPSPTKAKHVYEDLKNKIPLILDGGNTDIGLESTIVSLVSKTPRVLRPGKITVEELKKYLPNIEVLTEVREKDKPLAPGMKYRHYSPSRPVILVVDVRKIKNIVENERKTGNKVGLICTSKSIDADEIIFVGKRPENLGKILFDALRFLDKKVDVIVVEGVKEEGFGLAVMNRLKRAASRIV